jgi:hypothetical protein
MTLTTSLRNVGVGLVVATGTFAGTPAVTAVVVYGLLEVVGSLLLALGWGRRAEQHPRLKPPAEAGVATEPCGLLVKPPADADADL